MSARCAASSSRPRSYRKYDLVTWHGSEWRARCDEPGALPGDGWVLTAQSGSRGKAGDRGPAGAAGAGDHPLGDARLSRRAGDERRQRRAAARSAAPSSSCTTPSAPPDADERPLSDHPGRDAGREPGAGHARPGQGGARHRPGRHLAGRGAGSSRSRRCRQRSTITATASSWCRPTRTRCAM